MYVHIFIGDEEHILIFFFSGCLIMLLHENACT